MTKAQKIVFCLVVTTGVFLLLFRLARHDMLGDDAHYAFRSIGYFDYMASEEQTTPVQWFGYRPWWSFLSFHDHPPLYFFVHFMFFKIFGVSVFTARLPEALASLGSLILVYLTGKQISGITAGLFAAGALAVNNYFIWTGRVGLLESIFVLFFLWGLFYLIKAFQESSRFFVWTGLFFGLSFLTKYTFLFFAPGLLVYLLWRERQIFKKKNFWTGVLVFFIVISPVIIYNLMVFKTRGHFDVQFSDLFRQEHQDWTKLSNRVAFTDPNLISVLRIIIDGFSWPYFVAFAAAFLVACFPRIRDRAFLIYLPLLIIVSQVLLFSPITGAARWQGVVSPFAAIVLGYVLANTSAFPKFKYWVWILAAGIGLFSLFYTINTNHLRKAVFDSRFYADFRLENIGYNQLDKQIFEIFAYKKMAPLTAEAVRLWWYQKIQPEETKFAGIGKGTGELNSLIIYDSETEWFPTLWIFERQKLYRRMFAATAEEYFKIINNENNFKVLQKLNIDGIYLIDALPNVSERSSIKFPEHQYLVEGFKNQNISSELIYDDQGREAFRIYHGSFK